jgi:hypothetical protein
VQCIKRYHQVIGIVVAGGMNEKIMTLEHNQAPQFYYIKSKMLKKVSR